MLALALLVGIAFLPALGNDFVNWDDLDNFVTNPDFGGLGWSHLKWACTTCFGGTYQPLSWVIHEAQASAWGLDPRGYHLTSLVLHAVNAIVLFLLTLALLARCRPEGAAARSWTELGAAGFAVALFALHPLRAEVVAWATCQVYLSCALFYMLAVFAYLHANGLGSRLPWLMLSFMLFVAALLCHAPAVSLPLILLILDAYPLRRLIRPGGRWSFQATRGVLLEKLPFLALSLFFTGVSIYVRHASQALAHVQQHGLSSLILLPCSCICFYLTKTLVPAGLCNLYPVPAAVNWAMPSFLASVVVTAGLSAGALLLRRRWPGLLAGWLAYLALLAPTMGLIRGAAYITADHYGYLPLASLTVVAAGVLGARTAWTWRRWLAAVGAALLAGLSVLTWHQCLVWRDSITLWTHTIRHAGASCSYAHQSLGSWLIRQERLEEGEKHLVEALRLNPANAEACQRLGLALLKQGRCDQALILLAEAVRLAPEVPENHCDLGLALASQGRLADAERAFMAALRLQPSYGAAHNGLALVLLRQGRFDEALAPLCETVRLQPDKVEALVDLGVVLLRLGRLDEAAGRLTEAVRLQPDHGDAHNHLGLALALQGRLAEAIHHFREAVRLNPGDVDAHQNLGRALAQDGNRPEAIAQYTAALQLNPNHDAARRGLAEILRKPGGQ
jgi:Flp pilus assembly protein TadD